nr:MAG TPA: hypothetical protein [Caudoviricetes sp.]
MHNCQHRCQLVLESQYEPSRGTVEANGLFCTHQCASLFPLLNLISYTSNEVLPCWLLNALVTPLPTMILREH